MSTRPRQLMTMRATIVRANGDADGSLTDDWGGELADPDPQVWAEGVPCYAWQPVENVEQLMEASGMFGVVRMIVPAGTDVSEEDVIDEITDRRGNTIFDGPLRVFGISQRNGYVAVMLRVQVAGQV